MAQYVMGAMEGQKVVTCYIPGVFLQSDWPENYDCYIKFESMMAEMLCEIDPSYKSKVLYTKDRQRKFLYGNLEKAVYGTILGAILFDNKLSQQLEYRGFKKNKYDDKNSPLLCIEKADLFH